MKEQTIGQALLATWKKERLLDTSSNKVAPIEYYLNYNYQERYVKLCNRLSIKPVSLGAWLRKPVNSVI